jgi:hypothetical protein
MFFIELLNFGLQLRVNVLIVEVTRDVVEPLVKPFPDILIDVLAGVFFDLVRQLFAEVVIGHGIVGDAKNGELVR